MRVNWLYFFGTKTNKTELFVYGLSLPTESIHVYAKEFKLDKIGDKRLYLFESVSDAEINLSSKEINLQKFHNNTDKIIKIISQNKYIQNHETQPKRPISPIASTINLEVFYTKDFYEYNNEYFFKEENKDRLIELIKVLDSNSNQGFREYYYQRLGCFEYGKVMPWAETKAPYSLTTTRETFNNYKIMRSEKYKNIQATVHLSVFSDYGNILLDEIKSFEKDSLELMFETSVKNDIGYKYSIFDKNGKLIFKDSGYWMLGLSLQMNMASSMINIETTSNNANKTIQNYTPLNPIEVYTYDNKIDEVINNNINIIKSLCKPSKKNVTQKWFDKNEEILDEIMKFFNQNLQGIGNEILFIDPFFSKMSLYPLAHINNSSVKINVISCWKKFDPDSEGSSRTIKEISNDVAATIKKLDGSGLAASNLIWHNFGEDNFHDRFVYIKNTSNYKIFTISNSINNLLGKYNVLIVELDGVTKANVKKYIDNLISNCTINNRIFPEANSD